MDSNTQIFGPHGLDVRPSLIPLVLAGYAEAQNEGAIPLRRSPPSGEETIVWCGAQDGAPTRDFAFATFYQTSFNRTWIDVVFVPPHVRRMGIGQRLLQAILLECQTSGVSEVSLGTHVSNEAMRRCAERAGLAVTTVTMSAAVVKPSKTRIPR